MMKWLIYQGILYLQTTTDEQQQWGNDMVGLDRREIWAVTCSVMTTDGRMTRQRSYHKAWAASVMAQTGLSTYGCMPKPGSTYDRSGNLAELCWVVGQNRNLAESHFRGRLLLLVCVSFTIIGQPRNSVLIRRV